MSGFERAPFGNGGSNVTTNVHTQYGARTDKGPEGVVGTCGIENQASWEFTGADVGASTRFNRWLIAPSLPAGAIIKSIVLKTKEAFVLGGTTPQVAIGTDTTESTNGALISESQLENLGSYVLAAIGTWASPLASATAVDVALVGSAATATTTITIPDGLKVDADDHLVQIDGVSIDLGASALTAAEVATAIAAADFADKNYTVTADGADLIFTREATGASGNGSLTIQNASFTTATGTATIPAITFAGGADAATVTSAGRAEVVVTYAVV